MDAEDVVVSIVTLGLWVPIVGGVADRWGQGRRLPRIVTASFLVAALGSVFGLFVRAIAPDVDGVLLMGIQRGILLLTGTAALVELYASRGHD